jgi:hypothetical protein
VTVTMGPRTVAIAWRTTKGVGGLDKHMPFVTGKSWSTLGQRRLVLRPRP